MLWLYYLSTLHVTIAFKYAKYSTTIVGTPFLTTHYDNIEYDQSNFNKFGIAQKTQTKPRCYWIYTISHYECIPLEYLITKAKKKQDSKTKYYDKRVYPVIESVYTQNFTDQPNIKFNNLLNIQYATADECPYASKDKNRGNYIYCFKSLDELISNTKLDQEYNLYGNEIDLIAEISNKYNFSKDTQRHNNWDDIYIDPKQMYNLNKLEQSNKLTNILTKSQNNLQKADKYQKKYALKSIHNYIINNTI